MKIDIINKRNYAVNDKLKDVIEKKVSKFEKYFDDEAQVKVLLKSEGNKCNMELSLSQGKTYMRAEATADNMYDAIDIVLPKLEKQILRHKSRFINTLKQNAFKTNEKIYADNTDLDIGKVTKIKKFELEPLTEEEAMFRLDMAGHEFYVYLDSKTGTLRVLYKRLDGNYGVIIPKY